MSIRYFVRHGAYMDTGILSLPFVRRLIDFLITALVFSVLLGMILTVMGFLLYFVGAGDYYISFIKDLFALVWNYLSIILTTTYLFITLPKWNEKVKKETQETPGCSVVMIKMLIIAAILFWGTLFLQEALFGLEKFTP